MRMTTSRYWVGVCSSTAQYRWRITPGPSTSSSGTVAPGGASIQSRLPPERSQLDVRQVEAALKVGSCAKRLMRGLLSVLPHQSYWYDKYPLTRVVKSLDRRAGGSLMY